MPPPPSSSGIPESFGIPIWSVDGFPSPNEDWKVFFGQVEGLASGTSPSALHSPGESAEAWAYLLSDSSILDEGTLLTRSRSLRVVDSYSRISIATCFMNIYSMKSVNVNLSTYQ